MSKTDLVCSLLRQQALKLSQAERILLEVKLFICIYQELFEVFTSRYKEYQQLIKADPNQEENMCRIKFMQEMIRDILSTKEYSISGIAAYTHIPEEVLSDMVAGMNTNPTFEVSRKIFELHIGVRRDLYDEIMRKVISEYLVPT